MKIVYFDGYCNVCNRFVDFLLRHDHKKILKYASLQGATAGKRLAPHFCENVNTMVLEDDGVVFEKSSAAIRSIAYLDGIYSLMKVFLIIPRPLRDLVYQWVADHRYLWFGKRDTCRVASEQERAQILD